MRWPFSSSFKEIGPTDRNFANGCEWTMGLCPFEDQVAHLLEVLWIPLVIVSLCLTLSHFVSLCLTLSHFVSLCLTSAPKWCLMMFAFDDFDGQLCCFARLKPMLHHFKLAGSSRDHWLMPWDVPIASLWDHTALSPSSCLRVTPQKKTNKTKLLPNFWTHFVWFHHIMSLRIPKMRACSIQRCRKNIAEGYMREHPAFGKRSRDAGAIASPISLPSWQPFAVCLWRKHILKLKVIGFRFILTHSSSRKQLHISLQPILSWNCCCWTKWSHSSSKRRIRCPEVHSKRALDAVDSVGKKNKG